MVPKIKQIWKKTLQRRPGPNGASRTDAKEGGGGEVNLPPGSEGWDDQIGSDRVRRIGGKEAGSTRRPDGSADYVIKTNGFFNDCSRNCNNV